MRFYKIWFSSNGKRLIDAVIDKNLDLDTKIGKEIKKSIIKLMDQLEREMRYKLYSPEEVIKDDKGREFISFEDSDFENALKLYEADPNKYGALVYAIDVLGNYYIGITERTLDERFREHIIDSIRYYVKTNGDTSEPGYGKLQKAIINILQSKGYDINSIYRELKTYCAMHKYDERNKKIDCILFDIESYIMSHIIELHYGSLSIQSGEKKYTKQFPIKKLIEEGIFPVKNYNGPDYIDLKNQGLNVLYGGGGSGSVSLPIYDLAIMIALGLSAPKISEKLISDYGIRKGEVRTVQEKINNILGGAYQAQDEFLRPVIEHLVKVGINRYDIYLAFKDAELMNAWFSEWSLGREFLKPDIEKIIEKYNLDPESNWETIEQYLKQNERYYAGIPESQWIEWILSSKTFYRIKTTGESISTVQDELDIGDKKIKKILDAIYKAYNVNNKNDFIYKYHRQKAIEILKNGFIEKTGGYKEDLTKENFHLVICKHVFNLKHYGLNPYNSRKYFEQKLFEGMEVSEIWRSFYRKRNY